MGMVACEGKTVVWIFDAVQPDGSDDVVEIHLATGGRATVSPIGGVKRTREVEAVERGDDTAPPKKKRPTEGGATLTMQVSPEVGEARQEAEGGGRCCFDVFARMHNYLKGGQGRNVTPAEARAAVVHDMLLAKNQWMETLWDKRRPDGTGRMVESGFLADYARMMQEDDAWGSTLEVTLLARRYKINVVLLTEGKRRPELIPGSAVKNRSRTLQTGVMGFQN